MANPYVIASFRRHQQNMAAARHHQQNRSKRVVVPKKPITTAMPVALEYDVVVTLSYEFCDNEDIIVTGRSISGVEVGRFTVPREDNMLLQHARTLMKTWEFAKVGKLKILTAHGRLLEAQDDTELLTDLLDCDHGEGHLEPEPAAALPNIFISRCAYQHRQLG